MRLGTKALALMLLGGTALLAASQSEAGGQLPRQRVEVVFVLDTTGSMASLIDGAKRKIWSIASSVVEANPQAEVAMALVAYRDRGDDYVTEITPLSEDIQGLYGKLIRLEADGGGDTPESVNEALDRAISGLQWSAGPDVKRIVFLVGDAPPHMDYAQERQYPAILKQAEQRGIVVNAVQAGDMVETTEIWQEIAQFGHGRYIAIPQSGGEVSVIITPYDDDILELQHELDSSVVPYGDNEKQSEVTRRMHEKSAAPAQVQIENSEYYSKRSIKKEVITGGGDLIADARNKSVDVGAIAEQELPAELKAQPKAARQAWVDAKAGERQQLEDRMSGLIAKRDAFVAAEHAKGTKAEAGDSFDRAVEDTLRTQLK